MKEYGQGFSETALLPKRLNQKSSHVCLPSTRPFPKPNPRTPTSLSPILSTAFRCVLVCRLEMPVPSPSSVSHLYPCDPGAPTFLSTSMVSCAYFFSSSLLPTSQELIWSMTVSIGGKYPH